MADDHVVGEVLRVDRFGNLITNIDRKTFDRVATDRGSLEIQVGTHQVGRAPFDPPDGSAVDLRRRSAVHETANRGVTA